MKNLFFLLICLPACLFAKISEGDKVIVTKNYPGIHKVKAVTQEGVIVEVQVLENKGNIKKLVPIKFKYVEEIADNYEGIKKGDKVILTNQKVNGLVSVLAIGKQGTIINVAEKGKIKSPTQKEGVYKKGEYKVTEGRSGSTAIKKVIVPKGQFKGAWEVKEMTKDGTVTVTVPGLGPTNVTLTASEYELPVNQADNGVKPGDFIRTGGREVKVDLVSKNGTVVTEIDQQIMENSVSSYQVIRLPGSNLYAPPTDEESRLSFEAEAKSPLRGRRLRRAVEETIVKPSKYRCAALKKMS